MKKLVKEQLNLKLITNKHHPAAEATIRAFKEKMSLLLWQKKEKSFRSYIKYINAITASLNKDVQKISFLPQTSMNALFSIAHIPSTFSRGEKVYKLYTQFQKKALLKFKQSTQLGTN